ncbi:MAG: dTDP-glucose 4,6-dehydratase [Rikenellaceae bacterium]
MINILVTGGAGFIGANFVKYMLRRYNDVSLVVLDALTYAGNIKTISNDIESGRVEFVKGDICDAKIVNDIFEKRDIDFVVHFAAESHVDRSIENPQLFLVTNILGTQNLLECAKKSWSIGGGQYKKGKKFIHISTDEVYGSLKKDFDTPIALKVGDAIKSVVKNREDIHIYGDSFFTEDTHIAPHSPYSASKASSDMIVIAYHDTYGFPINITRCSNNYGAYQFPEKLIPLVIKNIIEGKKIPVYGKGDNVRDWLFVEDHAKAIDTVMRKGVVGEVYNIGGFNEETNINMVRLMIDIIYKIMRESNKYHNLLKIDVDKINYDLISFVTDRLGHDMRYAIDPTKIATDLGWYPETPFSEGIEKTIRWYLDNQEWVSDVTSGEYQKYYDKMYNGR